MGKALGIHKQNALDCEYLIDYFLGDQDILSRIGGGTSNINNTTVVNFAFPITREIVGYTYGSPTEFIPKKLDYHDDVTKLSDIFSYENSTNIICTKAKKIQKTNVTEDMEKREPLYIVSGDVNWCTHYGKHYGNSSNH